MGVWCEPIVVPRGHCHKVTRMTRRTDWDAAKVGTLAASGDWGGAQEASDKAKLWSIIGAVSGLVGGILYFVFMISMTSGGSRF